MIPEYFRDRPVPKHIKNKTQLIAWVFETFIDQEPISNWEMVRDLHCHRFGGIIFNLRKLGYKIVTVKGKQRGSAMYYCTEVPSTTANIS